MVQRCGLVIVGDYVEGYEVLVPFQALQAFGMKMDAVCPGKKAGDTCKTAIHDFLGYQTYSELQGEDFELNATFEEVDISNYDLLVIPGGRAAEYLSIDDRVVELVKSFGGLGRPIACTGHGLLVLVAADLLRGKKCTAYPTLRPVIEDVGGLWVDPDVPNMSTCVADGILITAAGWPGHSQFLRLVLIALNATLPTANKEILMVCGDHTEDYEVKVPLQAFEALGWIVHTAGPGKKEGEECITTVIGKQGHTLRLNADFDNVNSHNYDLFIIPGGDAPEILSLSDKVLNITRDFAHANKPLAAICHGPQVLAAAGVIKGRKITGFQGVKHQVIGAGGEWVEAETLAKCFKDGNIVTGATWFGNVEFVSLILSMLEACIIF